ncbi:hypothetical protein SEVIR_4G219200v4 [Setaria viridis]|uniref:Uncharacterized protein n=1 Tax=Setaria viridis TaxID=4556 RepID=A0A4U6VE14_SETVI|nr:hypothetical protein SEVIR_4G219200v2 [Setaria viridis]
MRAGSRAHAGERQQAAAELPHLHDALPFPGLPVPQPACDRGSVQEREATLGQRLHAWAGLWSCGSAGRCVWGGAASPARSHGDDGAAALWARKRRFSSIPGTPPLCKSDSARARRRAGRRHTCAGGVRVAAPGRPAVAPLARMRVQNGAPGCGSS